MELACKFIVCLHLPSPQILHEVRGMYSGRETSPSPRNLLPSLQGVRRGFDPFKINLNFIYIQGDSGGICTTLGNDSMSDSKQKSSYEHGPILNGYGVMTA